MKETPPLGSPKSSPAGALGDSTKPVDDSTKPVDDSAKPVDATTKPGGSPQKNSAPPRLWSRPWPWIGVGLAAVALAYGFGRLQGAQALTNAEQRHAMAIETRRATLEACEIDRGLLTARRSLALVALSLDRRNFGVAESHRRDASQTLEQPRLSGLSEVASLTTTIRALNLGVDPDPGAKREQVIAASEALDRLLTARARTGVPTRATSAAQDVQAEAR